MVRKTKELVKVNGILHKPNPEPGKMLKYGNVKSVLKFYDDDISRCVPGKRDFASVKEQRRSVHRQKRN
jgi:hypothetical protein